MINQTKITDYALVYLLVAFSGIPFFYRSRIEVLIGMLLIPLFVFIYRGRKLDKFFLYYVAVALLVQMGQMLKFYHLPLTTFAGLHVRLLFAYFTIRAVGTRLVDYYIRIIVVFVIISAVFYLPSYSYSFEYLLQNKLAPMFQHPLLKVGNYKVPDNIILYTINTKGEGLVWLKRNSGPFWEPGAFAGFLMIALLFNIIRQGKLATRSNLILIAGLISTFSTTGLLVLGVVLILYFVVHRQLIHRWLMMPLVLLAGIWLFVSVDFLGAKVVRKLSFTNQTYNTRFKSAQKDLMDVSQSWLVGLGRSKKTRFADETEKRKIHRNNGVTNFLAMYGLPVFLLYFGLIYYTFHSLCRYYQFNKAFALGALIVVLLIGFSEEYFTKVFFIALSMLAIVYRGEALASDRKEVPE